MPRKRKSDLQEVAPMEDALVAEPAEVTLEVAPTEVSLADETPIGATPDVAPIEEAPIDTTPELVIAEVAPLGNTLDDTQNVVNNVNLKEASAEKTPIKELKTPKPVAKRPTPLKARDEGRRPKNQLRFVR